MDASTYIEQIAPRFEAYYDLTRDDRSLSKPIPLVARFHQRDERYVGSRQFVAFAREQHEYVLFLPVDGSEESVREAIALLEEAFHSWIVPDDEHMQSLVRGVLLLEQECTCLEMIRHYSFYRSFRFGLRGWGHIALVAVDLHHPEEPVTNKKGKRGREIFRLLDVSHDGTGPS